MGVLKQTWICGLLLTFLVGTVRSNISWNKESVHTRQGEPLIVTCSATDVGMIDAVKIELRRVDKPVLMVAANDDLTVLFRKTLRYSAGMKASGDLVEITLNISAVRGEDSGELVCYTLENPDRKATLLLSVDVPVKSVEFEVTGNDGQVEVLHTGKTYTLKEGFHTDLKCVVLMDGTRRLPDTTISLEGEDVTDMFKETNFFPSPSTDLDSDSSKSILSYATMFPDRKFNGKELHCLATAHMGYQAEANIYLEVFYKPIVTCTEIEYIAQPNSPFSVTCHVQSNPTATMTYQYEDLDYTEHPHADQFRIAPQHIHRDEMKIVISIHSVHATHYGRYLITATNDYGSGTTEFSIHQGARATDSEPPTPTQPKPTKPRPTEKKQEVDKTRPPKVQIPREQPVLEPEEPQASKDGSAAPAMLVSMTTVISVGILHIVCKHLWL